MLLFLDLETTELDTAHAEILEVACIVTDDQLVERWRYSAVTDAPFWMQDWQRCPLVVREMHATNGLWGDCIARGISLSEIERHIVHHVGSELEINAKGDQVPINLAGNSVWFDHNMVRRCMPNLARMLSHRHLDVTSFNELARRQWPKLFEGRPDFMTHRAMRDAECSLATARYYSEQLRTTFDQRAIVWPHCGSEPFPANTADGV